MMKSLQNLLTGVLFTIGLLAGSYWKSSAQQIVQLGTDTTYDNIYSPISISPWGKNTHFQQLYTAAELNTLGVTGASIIDSLAINVYQAPQLPLPGYAVKIKNTAAASIAAFDGLALSQVYTAATFTPVAGQWNWLHFQNPFFWDGSSNLIIDFCFDTTVATPAGFTGKLRYSESLTGGTAVFRSVASACNDYNDAEPFNNRTNIKLSMRSAPACTGTPATPNLLPGGPFNICPSEPVTLNAVSSATGSGLSYTWQQSVDNGATWQNITGVSGSMATFAVGTDTTQFRVQLTCSNTNQTATSLPVQVNPNTSGLIYRPLPYSQDFEQWQSRCSNLELPDSNWAAFPATGNASWRREDQGDSASWTGSVVPTYYMPVSSANAHSARFHTTETASSGSLSVYADCSGAGVKTLRFDYMNKATAGSNANMEILVSTDAGATFTQLAVLNSMGVSAGWEAQTFDITSGSVTTIIKFTGHGEPQWGDFDMGIDNLRILPACTGTPLAGTVDSATACLGSGVALSLTGTTAAGGLTWQWQQSTNGITWDDVIGGTQEVSTTPLNQDTWFRAIVTCANSGAIDTSAPRLLHLQPFYNCYCNSASTAPSAWVNMGNVKLITASGIDTLINNGNPLPQSNNLNAKQHYTDYTNTGIADMIKDSTYIFDLSYITSNGPWAWPVMSGSYTKIYIDYNHNSIFDTDEIAWEGSKPEDTYNITGSYTVPGTVMTGITRMRIVTNTDGYYDPTVVEPCGPYYGGETEDYLVHIHNAPCTGNINAGIVNASDTLLCPGYLFNLVHSGFDTIPGLTSRIWQASTNGTLWNDVPGTENTAQLSGTFAAAAWYRIKATCRASGTQAFSNAIALTASTLCYCTSYADGGFSAKADSSDIGGFALSTVDHPLSGGHLNNALAIRRNTDFSREGIISLYVDSTYNFSLDHILLRNTHADARITMFADFNCNGVYDIPEERIYTGKTTATTWHKTATITIPAAAVLNTVTGLRMIINNDTAANAPSDEGCGTFVSGETEDYLVKFQSNMVGINQAPDLRDNLTLFPNPSGGTVAVAYNGATLENADLLVQTVTGQTIQVQHLGSLKRGQVVTLDLHSYSKGIYFIKITSGKGSHMAKVVLQ
ncbi:GEVED domain-containing protein [Taibaiella helva]|uniref:GEVED domain-containing protein n=1 Tax=Taibaiella helva TaxID=2301235 RepID=UPI0013001746|nr:GEVED domain-containing protein [Taibaiella helva]